MNEHQATVLEETGPLSRSANVFRWFAHLLSLLFHPVFGPLYILIFLLYVQPVLFVGFSADMKVRTLLIVTLNLIFFPLLTVVLLRALGFIDSIFLKTQKDRIIPYVACGIFFFWAYLVFRGQPHYPALLKTYILGVFLASSAALIANIYLKVSMHMIGAGCAVGFLLLLFHTAAMPVSAALFIAVLLSGLIGSIRLFLTAHQPAEIYLGFAIGLLTQYAALFFTQ
jgi:hypothetical protein